MVVDGRVRIKKVILGALEKIASKYVKYDKNGRCGHVYMTLGFVVDRWSLFRGSLMQ